MSKDLTIRSVDDLKTRASELKIFNYDNVKIFLAW